MYGRRAANSRHLKLREPCNAIPESGASPQSDTIKVMEEFQALYRERLIKCRNSGEDNSDITLEVMEDWVCDLSEQNKLLLNEIEVLEKEASERPLAQPSASAERLIAKEELTEKNKRLYQLESEVKCLKEFLSCKELELEASVKQSWNLEQTLAQKIDECAELKKCDPTDRISHLENDLCSLNRALKQKDVVLDQYMCQVEELQERIAEKENELEEERLSGCSRLFEMESKVEGLRGELNEKESQLEKYNNQIAELNHCISEKTQVEKSLVDQCLMTDDCSEDIDDLSKVKEDLKLKEVEVKKMSLQLKDLLNFKEDSKIEELHRTLANLQRASRDVQSALTAEVAEKHDTVVALRREVAQLEEQLRQSDMQTHFKDDIIKQLRKEVKVARAKESLAEIFGLKECPRVQMKEKIERLNAELEDKQSVITNLEQKLEATQQQELEEKINKLNKQLMSRERDVLTLCNKMDYVRRYVKRLRDDEELSIKCGLEALLHELNEDSEWNKETRRSVSSMSDHISDSVIIINRVPSRSLSLPDSSIQKRNEWNLRTWSEAGAFLPESSSEVNIVSDASVGVCKLRELQRNLDDSSSKLSKMWKDIKLLSLEISNNTIYNDLEEFKDDTKLDHEALEHVGIDIQNIIRKIEHGLSSEVNEMDKKYLLCCLENNLTAIIDIMKKPDLLQSDSVHIFHTGSADQINIAGLSENLAAHLCDSVSILQQIKNSCETQEQIFVLNKGVEDKLKEIQLTLDDVIGNRKRAFHKLCCIQKVQSESYCNIAQKFATFDEMYNIHEATAKCMKHEVINILRKQSSKDNQSVRDRNEGAFQRKNEIQSLRDTISAKEQEIMKKDRTICILKKSLSQKPTSLRGSHSSPIPGCRPYGDVDYEAMRNFDEKSFQTQQVVDGLRKEIESTMCKLLDREEKLGSLERVADTLNRSLYNVQIEMRNFKLSLKSSDGKTCLDGKIHKFEANLNQAELDVKRFLTKSQNYVRDKEVMEKSRIEAQRAIAALQSDLSHLQIDLSDSLKVMKVPQTNLLSHENTLVEGLRSQLDTYKKKVENLEEDLARNSVLGDYGLDPQLITPHDSDSTWKEDSLLTMSAALDNTQQQLFEMQQDMKKSLQEVYCSLSKEKSDTLSSFQITEEVELLRNEICELQGNLKSRQKVIDNQQETISLLEESLERSKCETDDLSSKLQTLLYEKKSVEMENQRVMQELQTKIEELEDTKTELCRQKEKLETQMKEKNTTTDHSRCKIEIKSLKDLLNDTEGELCLAKQQMNEMKLMIDELQTRLGDKANVSPKTKGSLQNELQHLKQIIEELTLEKDITLNELNQERAENSMHCDHIMSLKNEYEAKCQEVQHWLNRANKQKESSTEMFEEIKALQEENASFNENLKSLQCEVISLTNELVTLKNGNAQLSMKLMKSNQIVANLKEENQKLADKLGTEKEELLQECDKLMALHKNEVGILKEKEMELSRIYEQKCEEAALLNSEVDLMKKECGEKNYILQNHKEAVDFLSGKVAQLNMRLDDKNKEVEILECQIKELANKYKCTESSLQNECARVSLFENKLGSLKDRVLCMKHKIEELEFHNESLKLEKCELMERLEKKMQEDKDKASCAVALLNESTSVDNLREQRKFSVRLAQKLRVYKERLRVSIEQNRCLLEMLDKMHNVNTSLLNEMQKNSGLNWPFPWPGALRISPTMTSPDLKPCCDGSSMDCIKGCHRGRVDVPESDSEAY